MNHKTLIKVMMASLDRHLKNKGCTLSFDVTENLVRSNRCWRTKRNSFAWLSVIKWWNEGSSRLQRFICAGIWQAIDASERARNWQRQARCGINRGKWTYYRTGVGNIPLALSKSVSCFLKRDNHSRLELIRAIFVWPWKMVSVSVCYLFYQPMDGKNKTWTLRFPAKETLIWRRHCSIGQSCCSMTSKQSIEWFLVSSRAFA